jgi:hypothetical protein
MTRRQKEEIILQQQSTALNADNVHQCTDIWVNMKRLKEQKIDRYRRERLRQTIQDDDLQVVSANIQRTSFSSTNEVYLHEYKLFWMQYLGNAKNNWDSTGIEDDCHNLLSCGGSLLDRDPARAFALFNKACILVHSSMQHVSPIFIARLSQTFSYSFWSHHNKVKQMLLQHLHATAETLVDSSHPVLRLLKMMLGDLELPSMSRAVALMVTDSNSTSRNEYSSQSLRSQMCLLTGIAAPFCDTSVRVALSRLKELGRLNLAENDKFHEEALFAEIMPDGKTGRLEEAERGYLALVQASLHETEPKEDPYLGWRSCQQLGYVYYTQDRFDVAEEYARLALDRGIESYGEGDPDVASDIYLLERILEESGKEDELEQLRHDFAGVYAGLDKFYLKHDEVK